MRKFNKLFILISIILLSFVCISCKKSDEDRIREIFELEQLNGYIDVSNEKSKIVSRLKDSVEWSDKLNRDVDYYDLNYLLDLEYKDYTYSIDMIEHMSLIRYNLSMKEESIYDSEYNLEIMNLIASIPYAKIEYENWPYVIESYNKEFMFSNICGCGNCLRYYNIFRVEIFVYYNGYVHLKLDNYSEKKRGHYISLIPLGDGYKNIIGDAILEDYIEKK